MLKLALAAATAGPVELNRNVVQCCLICGSLISLRTPATTTSSSSPPLTPPLPPPPAAVAVVILYFVAGTIMHSSLLLLLLLSSSTAVLYLRYPSFLTFLLGRYPFETASAAAKGSTSMISSSSSSLSLSSLSAMTMTSSDKPVVFRPSVPLLYRLFFLFFLPDGGSNSFLTSPNRMSCSLSSSSLVPPVRSNTLSGDGFFSLFLLPSSILGIVSSSTVVLLTHPKTVAIRN